MGKWQGRHMCLPEAPLRLRLNTRCGNNETMELKSNSSIPEVYMQAQTTMGDWCIREEIILAR